MGPEPRFSKVFNSGFAGLGILYWGLAATNLFSKNYIMGLLQGGAGIALFRLSCAGQSEDYKPLLDAVNSATISASVNPVEAQKKVLCEVVKTYNTQNPNLTV